MLAKIVILTPGPSTKGSPEHLRLAVATCADDEAVTGGYKPEIEQKSLVRYEPRSIDRCELPGGFAVLEVRAPLKIA